MGDTFDITITAKPRNAILWRAAKKVGGQSALARLLGVSQSDMCAWVNLRYSPQPEHPQSPLHNPEKFAAFEKLLFEITGATFEDVFPKELRDTANRRSPRTLPELEFTRSVPRASLIGSELTDRLILPSPADVVAQMEIKEMQSDALQKAIKSLGDRERSVVEMRFGMKGKEPMTFDEVGKVLKITKERVRQIELRAMNKIKERLPRFGLPSFEISIDE